MYTIKQRLAIRAHYPGLTLRFRKDGAVEARKTKHGAWGTLYTPEQARRHLQATGLWKSSYELQDGRLVVIDGTPVFALHWASRDATQSYPIPPTQLDDLAHHIVDLLNRYPQQYPPKAATGRTVLRAGQDRRCVICDLRESQHTPDGFCASELGTEHQSIYTTKFTTQ